MLEFQTAGSILATIHMQEPQPRIVLLVEGPDDDAVLDAHLAPGALGITCGSRATVVTSVKDAQSAGLSFVLGLVDRDLKPETTGDEQLPDGVVVTEAYDLTADIAASKPGAITQAVTAHAHREARTVADQRGEPIELAVLDLATRYAGVRIAVAQGSFPVVLGGFDFRMVINARFETLGADAFANSIHVRDPHFSLDETQRELIVSRIADTTGRRELAGGHDLAGAAYGLLTKAGARQVSKDVIERTIRAFADCGLLTRLDCVRQLQRLARERTGAELFSCFELVA